MFFTPMNLHVQTEPTTPEVSSQWVTNLTKTPPPTSYRQSPYTQAHTHSFTLNLCFSQLCKNRLVSTGLPWGWQTPLSFPSPPSSAPSLWWTPRWSWSSHLHPSPPQAGTPWCACPHLSKIKRNRTLNGDCLSSQLWPTHISKEHVSVFSAQKLLSNQSLIIAYYDIQLYITIIHLFDWQHGPEELWQPILHTGIFLFDMVSMNSLYGV